jgi:glycosyltransferase involved in cell wall biosynthesis
MEGGGGRRSRVGRAHVSCGHASSRLLKPTFAINLSNVSVIIPLYNCSRFIAEAVRSVLRQTVSVSEILVVDDGSTDDSVAAVPSDPLVSVIRRPHAGLAATLNHGVASAKGEILAFLDSDDRWLPTKLEKQLTHLAGSDGDILLFGQARVFREGAAPSASIEVVNGVAKSALLLTRSVFDRIGPFPTEEGAHDFLSWYARAQELGVSSHVIPEVLFERRIHGENDGILQKDRQRANYFASLKTMLDRRRQNESK